MTFIIVRTKLRIGMVVKMVVRMVVRMVVKMVVRVVKIRIMMFIKITSKYRIEPSEPLKVG